MAIDTWPGHPIFPETVARGGGSWWCIVQPALRDALGAGLEKRVTQSGLAAIVRQQNVVVRRAAFEASCGKFLNPSELKTKGAV